MKSNAELLHGELALHGCETLLRDQLIRSDICNDDFISWLNLSIPESSFFLCTKYYPPVLNLMRQRHFNLLLNYSCWRETPTRRADDFVYTLCCVFRRLVLQNVGFLPNSDTTSRCFSLLELSQISADSRSTISLTVLDDVCRSI
jgi:hypothetical protein